jgi:POT family proton-dependent oligopeptide transporter
LFAWLWIALDRRGWQPSIPMKMFLGLVFMSASMAIMLGAAREENRRSAVPWTADLPAGIVATPAGQLAHPAKDGSLEPFHAGRLTVERGSNLVLDGVLDENERDRLIGETAPASFRKKITELQEKSKAIDGDKVVSAEVVLDQIPAGFDMKFAGLKKTVMQFKDGKLIAYQPMAEKEITGLLVAAGEPEFRASIHDLFVRSTEFRVSPMWLFWSYILATLGELCLSPVGLSMVSKLAPAKFATMLMGVWLLTSAFGNFAAGALGEIWGTIPPTEFFLLSTVVVGGAALVLLVLVHLITKTMHGVK